MSMLPAWPYPFWIAHRGAGTLAPENTILAFERGLAHGYRMTECDVTLSKDGVAFLLHDARLERTTDGSGLAVEHDWARLAQLDAGAWHGAASVGARLPTLAQLAALALARGLMVNLEIKPGPGDDVRCGRIVATKTLELWADAGADPQAGTATRASDAQARAVAPPLLSSFSREALDAARTAAPGLWRALLFERPPPDWLTQARALGCVAVGAEHVTLDAQAIAAAHAAGLRVLAYTVNDAADAERLRAAGLDGLVTDAVDRLGPGATAPRR